MEDLLRLGGGAAWLRRLGVRTLRTGLSWADFMRPNALRGSHLCA